MFCSVAVTSTTDTKKATSAATGKKRDVQTPVASTPGRQNHVANSQQTDSTQTIDDRQTSVATKDVSTHAAKRKKLARNDKLIGVDGFDVADREPTSTSDSAAAAERKSETPDRPDVDSTSIFERVRSPTVAEKPRDAVDATNGTDDRAIPEVESRRAGADVPKTGSSLAASGKDRADILDVDVEDEVADSFALFAPIKSASGAADGELPVSQARSRADSFDRLSTGGAAITMADSGYQTYDHDLSTALDDRAPQAVPDHTTKPEVTSSELEVQSSISEPDMGDAVARYSASSDSEISVELPSCASSSGADKPTTVDWQVAPPTAPPTEVESSHEDEGQRAKVARRASEEDLDQIRSDIRV